MDILKGSLDDISRPATVSRSRPGSRLLNSFQVDKQKVNSSLCSLEVLTPEPGISEWDPAITSEDGQETSPIQNSNVYQKGRIWEKMTSPPEDPGPHFGKEDYKDGLQDLSAAEDYETSGNTADDCIEGSAEQSQSAEDKIDPKLEKAIRKMKALDEVLLKKVAKEKEVKAQGVEIRKQLWGELQVVSQQCSARSHEESVNTNKFLALTPQSDNSEADAIAFEKIFSPLFSTQLPPEDYVEDPEDSRGNVSGLVTGDLLIISERSSLRKTQKTNKGNKSVNFIQRNIELVKDAGSHVLLMDDEKLRLEQLLGDVQDGCSDDDDDFVTNNSLWLVPGEGFTPEPGDLDKLAKIEAELLRFSSTTHPVVTSDHEPEILFRESKQEVSAVKFGNLEIAPGEKVLRYTKELREQKTRLKEIDHRLEDIQRSSSTASPATGCS